MINAPVKSLLRTLLFSLLFVSAFASNSAKAETAAGSEAYCTIRSVGSRLECLWIEANGRRRMNSQDISNFIDQAQISSYMTVRSRAGLERVFLVDSEAPSFKKLRTAEKSSSISDINKVKSELFEEIEAKVVKLSDELDATAAAAVLVKSDPSVALDHAKIKEHGLVTEVEKYHGTDHDYAKEQQTRADGRFVSDMNRARHHVSLAYEDVNFQGTFVQSSQMHYSSVDNMAAVLMYRLALKTWIFETEGSTFTASSNYNKGSSGGINYAGTDSQRTVYVAALRANKCYLVGAKFQVCPGAELIYDQFPVMSFKTLNLAGSVPLATSVMEMQSATDLTVGANIVLDSPLYNEFTLTSKLSALYGTGILGGSTNKVRSNSGFLVATTANYAVSQSLLINFGIEYLSRTAQFDVAGSTPSTTTVSVSNNGIGQFTSRVGLTWAWGEN